MLHYVHHVTVLLLFHTQQVVRSNFLERILWKQGGQIEPKQ